MLNKCSNFLSFGKLSQFLKISIQNFFDNIFKSKLVSIFHSGPFVCWMWGWGIVKCPLPLLFSSMAQWLWLTSVWLCANRNAYGKESLFRVEGCLPLWKTRRQSLIQWNFFRTFSRELNIVNVVRGRTCAGRAAQWHVSLTLAKHSSTPCIGG